MFIYKIENLINGKKYIGKSSNPEKRWKQHIDAAYKGYPYLICRAIKKYGVDAFSFDVIEESNNADVSALEIEKIKEFDCCFLDGDDKGYNMTRGGDGFDSESTKLYTDIRTLRGDNPFSAGNSGYYKSIDRNKQLVASGNHVFQSEKHKEIVSNTQKQLVASGKHSLQGALGSERSKAIQKRRIDEGTFHMHQPDMKEHQRQHQKQLVASGKHNSSIEHICPHCNKTGKGPLMFRWHFDKCKHAQK